MIFTTTQADAVDAGGASARRGNLCGDIQPKSNLTRIVPQKGRPESALYMHGVTHRGGHGLPSCIIHEDDKITAETDLRKRNI